MRNCTFCTSLISCPCGGLFLGLVVCLQITGCSKRVERDRMSLTHLNLLTLDVCIWIVDALWDLKKIMCWIGIYWTWTYTIQVQEDHVDWEFPSSESIVIGCMSSDYWMQPRFKKTMVVNSFRSASSSPRSTTIFHIQQDFESIWTLEPWPCISLDFLDTDQSSWLDDWYRFLFGLDAPLSAT